MGKLMNISEKVYQETHHFITKVENHGFDPISAFHAMFPRIMKELEHEMILQPTEVNVLILNNFFKNTFITIEN